jgi:hypothetical protein
MGSSVPPLRHQSDVLPVPQRWLHNAWRLQQCPACGDAAGGKMTLKLYDLVRLKRPHPKHSLPAGTLGTIVMVYES